jgi:broad specificity phosphatase PhoE
MKIILVRHGETEENKTGILMGQLDYPLSKTGMQQAKKVAARLKKEKLKAIYSSDLSRARQTTEAILRFHKGTKVHYLKELREEYLGKWQGMHRSKVDFSKKPRDAESRNSFKKRIKKALKIVGKNNKKDTILLVTHAGFIRMLLAMILNMKGYPSQIKHSNAAISIVEIDGKKMLVHAINSTEHL